MACGPGVLDCPNSRQAESLCSATAMLMVLSHHVIHSNLIAARDVELLLLVVHTNL
jgi:hypothetical protein